MTRAYVIDWKDWAGSQRRSVGRFDDARQAFKRVRMEQEFRGVLRLFVRATGELVPETLYQPIGAML